VPSADRLPGGAPIHVYRRELGLTRDSTAMRRLPDDLPAPRLDTSMDTDTANSVQPGFMLGGKYRVDRVLGKGGMGMVVAATHVELGERRAIKFMLSDLKGRVGAVERFMREARSAARLKSEHVVKIHDVGRFDTGEPYMVMEYLEGEDLGALLEQQRQLPPHTAVAYLLQALEALAEAHAAGIVHRDLKPANLFVAKDSEGLPSLKVLDFGISKLTDEGEGALALTRTTVAMGSPLYMSPEQMRSAKTVDARTDIWSIGIILYELLTGQGPFLADTITALCSLVLQTEPPPPVAPNASIPDALKAVVMRCLSKDREQRYANVEQLAAALVPFAGPDGERSLRRIRHALNASATGRAAVEPVATSMPLAAVPGVVGAPSPGAPHGPTVASSPAFAPPGFVSSTGASPATTPFPQIPAMGVQPGPAGPPPTATVAGGGPPAPWAPAPPVHATAAAFASQNVGPRPVRRSAGWLTAALAASVLVAGGLAFAVFGRRPAAAEGAAGSESSSPAIATSADPSQGDMARSAGTSAAQTAPAGSSSDGTAPDGAQPGRPAAGSGGGAAAAPATASSRAGSTPSTTGSPVAKTTSPKATAPASVPKKDDPFGTGRK
jgi:serine/threonine protein kinase